MKVEYEFRIDDADVRRHLGPGVGTVLGDGSVRKVVVAPDDPLFARIGTVDMRLRRRLGPRRGEGLYYSWYVSRRYSEAELEAAELFGLRVATVFEPEGEECGTDYDESTACPICGAGRTLRSVLKLDLRRFQPGRDIDTRTVPVSRAITQTIAGDEIIVAAPFVELMEEAGITGVRFDPIEDRRRLSPAWRQLVFTSRPVRLIAPTQFGHDPFDPDEAGEFRCPRGHVAGLNILSEATIERDSWDGSDIVRSEQFIGRRGGVIVPEPLLFSSPRVRRLYRDHRLKGLKFEVAHLG